MGKTNMHELAYGVTSANPHFGTVRNPWDLDRIAGGSSGGSGSAVAAGLVPMAMGSDTGGSIRIPASFCGTVGLKPSFGRVSRYGVLPLDFSLDHMGPLTQCVRDAALTLNVLAGFDPRDETCQPPACCALPPGLSQSPSTGCASVSLKTFTSNASAHRSLTPLDVQHVWPRRRVQLSFPCVFPMSLSSTPLAASYCWAKLQRRWNGICIGVRISDPTCSLYSTRAACFLPRITSMPSACVACCCRSFNLSGSKWIVCLRRRRQPALPRSANQRSTWMEKKTCASPPPGLCAVSMFLVGRHCRFLVASTRRDCHWAFRLLGPVSRKL